MIIKKLVFNFILVVLAVVCLDFAIGNTLRYFYFRESSGFHYRTTYAMETAEADILVFGSSRANHNYVPEIFEDSLKMSFYNTGRDGIDILFQTTVLKSGLERYTPKLIILDYYGEFEKETAAYDRLASLLPYYRTHKEVRPVVELRSPFEKIKLASEIYPFNSEILSIGIGNMEINKRRFPENKGYLPLYKEWNREIESVAASQVSDIDSVRLSALKEFINIAKEKNINVVVIYSPIFRKFEKNLETEICNGICESEHVPFWDFSKDTLFLNNRHLFQDVQHLNHEGAKIFSNIITTRFKEEILNISDEGYNTSVSYLNN
jgi:hypothetical protein